MSVFQFHGYRIEIVPSKSIGFDYAAHDSRGVGLAGFDFHAQTEGEVLERAKAKLREIESRPTVPAKPKNKDAEPLSPPKPGSRKPRKKVAPIF
jgi:hypothetical protein